MKLTLLRLATSLVAAWLMTACASVQNISLDKTGRPPIKSVALLKVAESQQFMVRDFSGMSALGGLIGGAIQGNIDDQRSQKFLEAVKDKQVMFGDIMVKEMQTALNEAGIEMLYLPGESPKFAADKKSDDYSHITTDKSAILNIWFGATGFVNTAKLSTEFQPWLVVNVRLVDPQTKAIIYQKTYNAGYNAAIANAEFISVDPRYKFGNFDDLMNRIDLGIEAISSSESIIARRVVADIK